MKAQAFPHTKRGTPTQMYPLNIVGCDVVRHQLGWRVLTAQSSKPSEVSSVIHGLNKTIIPQAYFRHALSFLQRKIFQNPSSNTQSKSWMKVKTAVLRSRRFPVALWENQAGGTPLLPPSTTTTITPERSSEQKLPVGWVGAHSILISLARSVLVWVCLGMFDRLESEWNKKNYRHDF